MHNITVHVWQPLIPGCGTSTIATLFATCCGRQTFTSLWNAASAVSISRSKPPSSLENKQQNTVSFWGSNSLWCGKMGFFWKTILLLPLSSPSSQFHVVWSFNLLCGIDTSFHLTVADFSVRWSPSKRSLASLIHINYAHQNSIDGCKYFCFLLLHATFSNNHWQGIETI